MPFITREGGEHFVVPSYRDVLTAKSANLLKKEIIALSQNYGEYITLQKKTSSQYEVAFSPDTGYLLGETVWHHFSRPPDLIYCEAIPNTSEVILVIVKSGSVYLDGTFPADSVTEELVVFLTQQNHFDIYIYGDVPISKEPAAGKFAFDASSVNSFTVLDAPVFPTLPLLKIYQLQLVSTVLEAHGIGVFPTRKIVTWAAIAILGFFAYQIFTSEQVQEVQVQVLQIAKEDPYALFYEVMASPSPETEIKEMLKVYNLFSSIPGWNPTEIEYKGNVATTMVTTRGALVQGLLDWGKAKNVAIEVMAGGFMVKKDIMLANRSRPIGASPFNETIAKLVDRLHAIDPENSMKISGLVLRGKTRAAAVTVDLSNLTPSTFALVGDYLDQLPVRILSMTVALEGNALRSTIALQVVGT